MPSVKPPSELINCTNLFSCFQAIYNFLFAILIALAFLNFLYGAFLYLLSGGGIYDKSRGKDKMINSLVAVIVALVVPIILNMVNPRIFTVVLQVPTVTVTEPGYEVTGISYEPSENYLYSRTKTGGRIGEYICNAIIGEYNYTSYNGPVMTNYQGYPMRIEVKRALEECVTKKGASYIITAGYDANYTGSDPCHLVVGNCIDIVPSDGTSYQALLNVLTECGFNVLNEAGMILYCPTEGVDIKDCVDDGGPCYKKGNHLHAILDILK
jgi:hypothetical protein